MPIHRYGLISDTHGKLHPDVHEIFQGTEAILHAGDVGDESVLIELKIHGAVYAICGNVDYSSQQLPLTRVVDLPFGKVGMAHGHRHSTDREGRGRELLDTFAPNEARLVIFGHSHMQHLEFRKGVWLVNPGAAGRPRFGVMPSVCVLEWDSDRDLLRFDFQPLDWR